MSREWNGTTDYIRYASAPDIDDLAVGGAFSMHIRLKADTTGEGGNGRVLEKRDAAGAQGGWIFQTRNTETLRFITLNSGGGVEANQIGAANACPLNAWHSVVVTYDDNGDRKGHIYVGGSEISYATDIAAGAGQNAPDATHALAVGQESSGTTKTFDGDECEVALWDRVITAEEIAALGNDFAPLFFGNGIVFYAPLVREVIDLRGHAPTVSGTIVTVHPRVLRPIVPQIASLPTAVPYVPDLFGDHPSEDSLRIDGANGAPTHTAPANTLYVDEAANELYISKGSGTWVNLTGGGGGGAPTDAEYVVGAADGDLSAEIVKAYLGDNLDPDAYPGSPDTLDDEFENGALDGKWTIVNDPAGGDAVSESRYAGFLAVGLTELGTDNFDNTVRVYQTPPAGAQTWTLIAKVAIAVTGQPTNKGEWASAIIYIGDSANDEFMGSGVEANDDDADIASKAQGMRSAAGSLGAMSSTDPQRITPSEFVYLRLDKETANEYDAANDYTAYFSRDGIIWWEIGSETKTFAAVCDEIGLVFRRPKSQTGTPHGEAIVDFFRRTA